MFTGYLYLRKFGLSAQERTSVIRAAGGSTGFTNVEKILRAGEVTHLRGHPDANARRGNGHRMKGGWKGHAAVNQVYIADEETYAYEQYEEPYEQVWYEDVEYENYENYDEGYYEEPAAEEAPPEVPDEELEEALLTYHDARNQLNDIRSARGFLPVGIPINQPSNTGASQPTASAPAKGKSKGKKASGPKGGTQPWGGKGPSPKGRVGNPGQPGTTSAASSSGDPKRQRVNFTYMAAVNGNEHEVEFDVEEGATEIDVVNLVVPPGYACIDLGCGRNVQGEESAKANQQYLLEKTGRQPVPYEARHTFQGFNGGTEKATVGNEWPIAVAGHVGRLRTGVVSGQAAKAPWLVSSNTLTRMGAVIDTENATMVATKINPTQIINLIKTPSGHFLMPMFEFSTKRKS